MLTVHHKDFVDSDECMEHHIRRIMELGCLKGKNYTLIGPRGYWPGPICTDGWLIRIFSGLQCLT